LNECSDQPTLPLTQTENQLIPFSETQRTIPSEDIQWLWHNMNSIYGHIWTSTYDDEAMIIWGAALTKRHLTREDLRRGISKCVDRGDKFPPNLPEFVGLCKMTEADLNLPSFEEAFHEATITRGKFYYQQNGYWKWAHQTHLAVYHAVRNIFDLFNFDHLPETEARRVFKATWQKVVDQLLAGKPLEPMPTVIEHHPEPQPKIADRTGKGYAEFKQFLEKFKRET